MKYSSSTVYQGSDKVADYVLHTHFTGVVHVKYPLLLLPTLRPATEPSSENHVGSCVALDSMTYLTPLGLDRSGYLIEMVLVMEHDLIKFVGQRA